MISTRSSYSNRASLSGHGGVGIGMGSRSSMGMGIGSARSGMGIGMGAGMGAGMGGGLGGGMGMGAGMAMRAGSVHGGAGGKGIRMSSASSSRLSAMGGGYGSGGGGGGGGGGSFGGFSMDAGAGADAPVSEKIAMQGLNHRLAQYLDKVRILEEANTKLEEQIKNWGFGRANVETRDFSTHLATIEDLRTKIHAIGTLVAELALQVDNTKLAADDFRIKYENELGLRQSVEADISGLRRMLGDMALGKTDLEMEMDNLKEELVFLKSNHEEEKITMQTQLTGQIHVEVDAAPQADLHHVISEIREQYESLVSKNRRDAEAWFKNKAEAVEEEVRTSTEVLQTSTVEVKSSQTTIRDFEMELQSLLTVKNSMEANLADMEGRYGAVMMGLQASVVSLEGHLTQIRADTERSSQDYQTLLDIKTRLEMEIAEYRRLLEGGDVGFAVKTGLKSGVLDVETSGSTLALESASISSSVSSSVSSAISSAVSSAVSDIGVSDGVSVTKSVTVVQEVVDGELVSSSTTTVTEEVVVEE